MATSVHHGGQIAWWREPTREQWHAWIAAWLGWTLDSFDFTIFVFIMLPISQDFRCPANRGDGCLYFDVVAAADRRHRLRLARRSHRPQEAADDLDRLVLRLQFLRRLLAELRVPVLLPRTAGHRHGRGVAGRRLARDGKLADPLARLHGGRDARLLGPGRHCSRAAAYGLLYDSSAGVVCCGSASCRPWRSSTFGSSSTSRRSGSKTAACSALQNREVPCCR